MDAAPGLTHYNGGQETLQATPIPETDVTPDQVGRGGYIVREGKDAVLVATGSELAVALEAAETLDQEGVAVRVVSMPCREAFLAASTEHRVEVLGSDLPIASLEAASTFGWGDVIGRGGLAIGVDTYGESAPAPALAEHFGLTADAVSSRVADWLDAR